jgi:hypothetical protein
MKGICFTGESIIGFLKDRRKFTTPSTTLSISTKLSVVSLPNQTVSLSKRWVQLKD